MNYNLYENSKEYHSDVDTKFIIIPNLDDLIKGTKKESPIFYMGNKYKLLKDIIPLFPNECDVFIDGFGGSGVVSINYKGKNRTIYNEYNPNIYNLVKIFKDNNYNTLDSYIQDVIDKYDLKTGKKRNMFDSEEAFLNDTNAKKIRYNKFRTQYNESLGGGRTI